MRVPFLSMFITSPFEGIQEHAEKAEECAWQFKKAFECIFKDRYEDFEHLRKEIDKLESEADAIKRRIRGHLPKGTLLPVDKFQLFIRFRIWTTLLQYKQRLAEGFQYAAGKGAGAADSSCTMHEDMNSLP